ncbi:unnamed protein product, partial [Nesidiocoris tenuis]
MQQNINSFLRRTNSSGDVTPSRGSTSGISKRPRSSPEKLESSRDKRPNMGANAELLKSFSRLMDEKLNKFPTRDDFELLRADFQAMRDENKQLREEINELKTINQRQERRIESLELRERQNNLVFRGLKMKEGDDPFRTVSVFIHEVLGLPDIALGDARRVGPPGRQQPLVLATMLGSRDKWAVIGRTSRLRGTEYSVSQDFPAQVRWRRSKLLRIRAELRKEIRELVCKVRLDRLVIGDNVYFWDDALGLVSRDGGDHTSAVSDIQGVRLSSVISGLL